MRLRRPRAEAEPEFDWREIVCGGEAEARGEAERRQAAEQDPNAEWVYLDKDRVWIARRGPRELPAPRKSLGGALLESLLNPFGW